MGYFADPFTRADSNTTLGSTPGGQAWSASNGVWGISSNRAYLVSETNTPADLGSQATIDVASTDQSVSAVMTNVLTAGNYPGIVARWESGSNFYLGYVEQTGTPSLVIYWRDGSVWTSLGSTAHTWVEGTRLTLRAYEEGGSTRLRLYADGVEKVTVLHSAAGRPMGTRVGLREDFDGTTGPSSFFDDFVATTPTVISDIVGIADVATPTSDASPSTVLPTMPRGAHLGIGVHQVFLYDRGGANRIGRLRGTRVVRWNRERDAISDATVILDPMSCDNDALDALWKGVGRFEIVIFRNEIRVWEGPITRVTWKATSVEVTAHDVCHYAARTAMRNAYDNRYSTENSKVAPVTERMRIILTHELARKEALNPPINVLPFLDVRTSADTANTGRFTPPYFSSVWEEMDHMGARLGLDYVAVGRRILLNDVHEVIGRTPMLTDSDFMSELIVTSYGMELATLSAVTDGEGRYAVVGGVDDYYGEVELIHTLYGEGGDFEDPDNPTEEELAALATEMRSQAQRNLAGRYPTPTVVRVPDGTRLNPLAPVAIEQLVPGVRVPVRATRLRIALQQEQKLDKITVEETDKGETISVKLSPVPGSTPWDDSTETSGDEEEEG